MAPAPAQAQLDVGIQRGHHPLQRDGGECRRSKAAGGSGRPAYGCGSTGRASCRISQTSGVALSGSYVPIYVTLDIATVTTLDPGSYAGLITIAATSATNGSATVAVNLVVSAGPPKLDAALPIFPASVIAGPPVDPVITIYGDNFFSTSVVSLQQGANPSIHWATDIDVPLLLSRKVLQVTIKAAYLAAPRERFTRSRGRWR